MSENVEEAQKFFQLSQETARQYLTPLVKALADECKKNDALFKVGAIDELRKINSKLNTLLEQPTHESAQNREIEDAIKDYLKGLVSDIRISLWEEWDIFAIPITICPGDFSFDGIKAIGYIKDKKVLLHGKPACGKTTAIERIMVTAKDQSDLIPVRLFTTDGCNASGLRDRMSDKLGLSSATCKELEEQGRFLFIFDGLNQEPEMQKVAEDIRVLSDTLRHSRFFVTCRSYEYSTYIQRILAGFRSYGIKDLTWDDQKSFIECRIGDESQKRKLLSALESHPGLKKACTNQFAFLLAIDAVPRAEIPPRLSSDLYERFLERFLGVWERITDIKAKRFILEEIAHAITYSKEVNNVSFDEETVLEKLVKAGVNDSKTALNDLFKHGFLESRQNKVEFFQESFQEFLVASWLIRKGIFPKYFSRDEKTGDLRYEGLKISKLTWQFYLELGRIIDIRTQSEDTTC